MNPLLQLFLARLREFCREPEAWEEMAAPR
jgi:hypothetical protein